MADLSTERVVLRDALTELAGEALRGRPRNQAIKEANKRRKGLPPLSETRVSNWFTQGDPASDFEMLWALVKVLLEWRDENRPIYPLTREAIEKEKARRERARQAERDTWRRRWEQADAVPATGSAYAEAQRSGLDDHVRGYLKAARNAAQEHPYLGLSDRRPPSTGLPIPTLPSLVEVYVRQHSRPADRDGHVGPRDGTAAGESGGTTSVGAEPAEAVFGKSEPVSVLIAGPGGGKSTLLSAWMREAADEFLAATKVTRVNGLAVPVQVSALSLAGQQTAVPDVLAAATCRLSEHGRDPGLGRDRFLEGPCAGAYWQLLVDGLDELPNADARRAVLRKLANAVRQDPPIYRCVVATRPLGDSELDVLGVDVPRYELQPFTPDDLRTYAEKYFSSQWSQEEAADRSQRFTDALHAASLTELARTPLMAFMLCQLYLATPECPLPDGRTAVYEEFAGLLYENNQSKHVAASHEEAIKRLVEGLQTPRARNEADTAARQALDRLPELIDYLAHQWITGHQMSAAEALASHDEAVQCPDAVLPELWETFVEDLLRHTGLLVRQANRLDFPHQTFREYHAARHATRNQRARAELLAKLFRPRRKPQILAIEQSYVGFLLDRLLASPGGIAAKTNRRIEAFTRRGGQAVCQFLVGQVDFRTNIRSAVIARQLTRFTMDTTISGWRRVQAARALAEVDGYRVAAADRLIALADTVDSDTPLFAAEALAAVDGYREAGADRLIALANNTTVDDSTRTSAAQALAWMDGYREAGADRLITLANTTTVNDHSRLFAAEALAEMDGYREAAADQLIALANDTSIDTVIRRMVARALAEMDGYWGAAADQLIALANDTTIIDSYRVDAARALAEMDGYREAAADQLIALANDTTIFSYTRIDAARALAEMDGYREAAADQLIALANDTYQVRAIRALAEVDGRRGAAAHRLIALADTTTLKDSTRVLTAWVLAEMDGYQEAAADRLIALADDTTLNGLSRVQAAGVLAKVDGYWGAAADRLIALADDTTLNGAARVRAAPILAEMDGYRGAAADRLIALADDTTLNEYDRVDAARALAEMDGYWGAAADRLIALADDTTLKDSTRVVAARALAEMDEHEGSGTDRLIALANDTTLSEYDRAWAAQELAEVDLIWESRREEGRRKQLSQETRSRFAAQTIWYRALRWRERRGQRLIGDPLANVPPRLPVPRDPSTG